MDTSSKRRRRWTVAINRQIVEESFAGDSSVAQLAKCNAKVESEIKKGSDRSEPFLSLILAVTYVPASFPAQYHRPGKA
jgi:hypothetical protein